MSSLVKAVTAALSNFPEQLAQNQRDPLFDLISEGIYVCDRDGVIVRYNRAAATMWGRAPKPGDPAERFCGSHRLWRLDGNSVPHAECPMAEVLATGKSIRNREIVIERPDGSRVVALVNIDAVWDADGKVVGAVNCFRDITELHGVQATFGGQRWNELLEALPVAVYTTDADGRITFYNQAAADLWQHEPRIGHDAWCGSWKLHWPDGSPMAHDECPMAVALKQGIAIRGAEAVLERPDSTRVPFLAYPTPMHDDSGVLTGAVNMLIDISDRKRGEEAAQRLASIVESSQDAIVSKNLDGIIMSWNNGAERLFGYRAEEVIGKPITMLIPPDRHDEEPAILERIRRGERVEPYETVRQRKDGSLVDVSLTVSPVRSDDGRLVGASKLARDITERLRAREQQRLLLREMNHRAKNLFALASSVVALSTRSARTPQDFAAAVQERLAALSRAHDLTLPDFAVGRERFSEATTLGDLLGTVVLPYENASGEDGARVLLKGPDVAVGGKAVASLALLLHEFATNAAKYGALSSSTGRVDVEWSVDGRDLNLRWVETGGPPPAEPRTEEGFGSFLARATVRGQFGGQITRDWKADGLAIQLSIPLDRLER